MGSGILGAGVWLAAVLPATAGAEAPNFHRGSLAIESADGGKVVFNIEIAVTQQQHEHGLMFRRSLPRDEGMLFVFKPAQLAGFWMKNTYIPLDMLFAREDGKIVKIVPHAMAHDETLITSGEPVAGVLEINAGEAERLGIKAGDRMLFPVFE